MDNKKFGEFIAGLRKEKGYTQSQLAEILCVTDKAVSKWERGVGFPDIKLIEPLSEALGVSILEIMQSEKAVTPDVSKENASDAIANVIDVVEYQRKIERNRGHAMMLSLNMALSILVGVTTYKITERKWLALLIVCAVICLCYASMLFTWKVANATGDFSAFAGVKDGDHSPITQAKLRKIVCFSGILGMIVQGLLVVYELARLPQNGIVLFGGIVAYVVALLICCYK